MWLATRFAASFSAGITGNPGSRRGRGCSPRPSRPAEETIATLRRDKGGPVTQGCVSKLGHSSSASRVACAGGKSVNRVIETDLHLPEPMPTAIDPAARPFFLADFSSSPTHRFHNRRELVFVLHRAVTQGSVGREWERCR